MNRSEPHPVQIVWFKRDLRIHDHAPLVNAASRGPCLGLYVYEPDLLQAPDFDAAHLEFINQSLEELRSNLRRLGSELILRRGNVIEAFKQLDRQFRIVSVWAHEETGNGISYQRDKAVRLWVRDQPWKLIELPSNGVIRRLASRDGWSRQWQKRMNESILAAPKELTSPTVDDPGSILQPDQMRIHRVPRNELQKGGESFANQYLESFLKIRGPRYRTEMSSPVTAFESCSRISPYLAYGNLSVRTVFQATAIRTAELKEQKKSGIEIDPDWLKSLSSFKSRLSWHCHFIQKLEDEPDIEFHNFNRGYDGLRENEFDRSFFDAWCQGRTGYPMVDACMRALSQTGWINFRMRAMLMSFAAYHLWLHWREPALHLARLFLDYEPGIHYSQCQMQSGVTGINTIRIYSPIKQVSDHDPQGIFIRKYLPELEGIPDKHLAEPHKMNLMEQSLFGCQIGKDYPAPIVDH
ncbi:MAG: deoxyribodipyrimidine photo-lyase/cryptochrome family protein, partial [Planctomycetota bacterium]